MKPMGEKPGTHFTRELRSPKRLSKPGGTYDVSKTEQKRIRRRVKRTGNQDGKKEVLDQFNRVGTQPTEEDNS